MKNDYVFPQDREDGQAGLARSGGIDIKSLAIILFAAAKMSAGQSGADAVQSAKENVKELFKP